MADLSDRLLDQRLRNRVMEGLFGLADWKDSLEKVGFVEYFETFFDVVPYEGPYPNATMSNAEGDALRKVHQVMVEACDATPKTMSEASFIASGWPQRIESIADEALRLMLTRGRFSEEREEAAPTSDDGWPWRERYNRH